MLGVFSILILKYIHNKIIQTGRLQKVVMDKNLLVMLLLTGLKLSVVLLRMLIV